MAEGWEGKKWEAHTQLTDLKPGNSEGYRYERGVVGEGYGHKVGMPFSHEGISPQRKGTGVGVAGAQEVTVNFVNAPLPLAPLGSWALHLSGPAAVQMHPPTKPKYTV